MSYLLYVHTAVAPSGGAQCPTVRQFVIPPNYTERAVMLPCGGVTGLGDWVGIPEGVSTIEIAAQDNYAKITNTALQVGGYNYIELFPAFDSFTFVDGTTYRTVFTLYDNDAPAGIAFYAYQPDLLFEAEALDASLENSEFYTEHIGRGDTAYISFDFENLTGAGNATFDLGIGKLTVYEVPVAGLFDYIYPADTGVGAFDIPVVGAAKPGQTLFQVLATQYSRTSPVNITDNLIENVTEGDPVIQWNRKDTTNEGTMPDTTPHSWQACKMSDVTTVAGYWYRFSWENDFSTVISPWSSYDNVMITVYDPASGKILGSSMPQDRFLAEKKYVIFQAVSSTTGIRIENGSGGVFISFAELTLTELAAPLYYTDEVGSVVFTTDGTVNDWLTVTDDPLNEDFIIPSPATTGIRFNAIGTFWQQIFLNPIAVERNRMYKIVIETGDLNVQFAMLMIQGNLNYINQWNDVGLFYETPAPDGETTDDWYWTGRGGYRLCPNDTLEFYYFNEEYDWMGLNMVCDYNSPFMAASPLGSTPYMDFKSVQVTKLV